MTDIEIFNPENYRLRDLKRQMEVVDIIDRRETTCLADLALYKEHPEWFIKAPESGKIDYDATLGPRKIIEAKRKLKPEKGAGEELLEETLNELAPSVNALWRAEKTIKAFLDSATTCLQLRGATEIDSVKLAYHITDVPSKLEDVRLLSGVIPESCIRACEDICTAVIEPCPPERTWEQTITTVASRSVSI